MGDLSYVGDYEDLLAWQSGDPDAGSRLFKAHYGSVARFLRNKVPDDARDDLVQETFLAASKGNFAGRSAVRTWLLGIAYRQLQNHYRRLGRQRRREVIFAQESAADLGQGPESFAVARQEQRLLLEGLRTIPLNYQIALELHYWEGMSASEIARVTDTPHGTVKTRIRDGRLKLEQALRRLALSPQVLKSTLDNLARWAHRVGQAWA